MLQGFWKDVAFGARAHLKTPGATAAVVVTLSFGIAASTLTFSLLDRFFIRPLPVRDPERLVRIYTSYPHGPRHFTVSYPDYLDMRALEDVFAGVLVEEPVPMNLGVAAAYERVWGERVSPGYFSLLGIRPAHGRFFSREEEGGPAAEPVVVIGHDLWQRRFGGSRRVLGQTILLNARSYEIVGVAPRGFQGISLGVMPDLWLAALRESETPGRREARGYFAMGRLQPGATVGASRAALEVLALQLERSYPASNRGLRFTVLPEREGRIHPVVRGGVQGFSVMLLAVAALVLLLACANVAAVQLARALSRRKEVALRLALGASRSRVVRQLLTEGAFLSLLAGGAGVALAWAVTGVLSAVPLPAARGAPLAFDLGLDARVLAFGLLVGVTTGILFGLTPALQASRFDLVAVLKEGAAAPGPRSSRLGSALVTVQVGLSMVLLIGGVLFLRSLQNAYRVDLGFDPASMVVASVDLGPRAYEAAELTRAWRRLVDRVASAPGMESVSLADRVPFEVNITTTSVTPEDHPAPEGEWPTIDYAIVDAGYFQTMRIPLLEGRDFLERDDDGSAPVAIANDAVARRFWPEGSAVGRRLLSREGRTFEVVGVARHSKHLMLGEEPKPYLYLPLRQNPAATLTVVARVKGDPGTSLRELRERMRAFDDEAPVYNVTTLSDRMRLAFLPATSGAAVLNTVALVALVLTAVGLYGTLAHTVDRRTYEIGVRRALGAQGRPIVWLVVRREVFLVALGMAGGAIVGYLGSRLLSRLLFGVGAGDPLAFGLAPALLLLVTVLAAWMPAFRATRIDPAVALRHE
jgi:predicted permease